MYNYGNLGRGIDRTFPDNSSGSGSSSATLATTAGSTQQQQKYSVAGSSQFVPNLNAVTSNQDLQWMLQPSILGTPGPSRALRLSYPLPPRIPSMNPQLPQSHLSRPGVIRAAMGVGSSTRSSSSRNDEHLSAEELERRRIRRERNKMAAAKCRNRRRELTDTLQNETDQLQDEKSRLQKEIDELQKQKEKLELVFEAHRPICKVQDSDSDSDSDSNSDLPMLSGIKIEPADPDLPGPSRESKSYAKPNKPKPKITIPPPASASTATSVPLESESLHTPVLISTPSLTPFTASLVFSYPSSSLDTSSATSSHALNLAGSHGTSQSSQPPQPCGVAHRRSSSSGDQSDHSLNSPTILTL